MQDVITRSGVENGATEYQLDKNMLEVLRADSQWKRAEVAKGGTNFYYLQEKTLLVGAIASTGVSQIAYATALYTNYIGNAPQSSTRANREQQELDVTRANREKAIPKVSKNTLKHINNTHNINNVVKQLQYMTPEQAQGILKKSYFNSSWSNETINQVVQYGINDAYAKNAVPKTGNYVHQYIYQGEQIEIAFNDGNLQTAYGLDTYDSIQDIINSIPNYK